MQRPLSLVVKVCGAVTACFLAYRGTQLYFKNDITIYITEVVHLPPAAEQRDWQLSPQSNANVSLTIEGTVEMETCVMNSYRFLLKLAGHVQSSLFDAKRAPMSPRSSRYRVLSLQASNTASDDSFVTQLSGNYGLTRSSNHGSSGSQRHGPSLIITDVDPIVDAYEADATGALAFTPACVGDSVLCRFTCVTSIGLAEGAGRTPVRSRRASSFLSPPSSGVSSPLPSGDSGLGSIVVRRCTFESDGERAYCQRLTLELEFIRPVFDARVLIRLPSRHCRLHRSHTGGVGSVTQLLHQPRKCVWDIGAVSEEMCTLSHDGTATSGRTEGLSEDNLIPGAVIPAAPWSSVAKSLATLELVFQQAPPAFSFGEDDEEAEATDSDDDMDNRFSSTGNAGGGLSHSRCQPSVGSRGSSTRRALTAVASTTSRASKREERGRKAREKAARIRESSSRASMRASSGESVPTVELMFSVNQLLSGTSVKKLQVVEVRPNWAPRSRLDHLVLRRVIPGLTTLKLKKYAYYTTWFVQPVAVSQL